MVIMSKSIGGYGLPFSLTLFKSELDIWTPGEHNGTFRGNQLSMIAAKAGLEFMLKNKIEREVKRKEKIIKNYLETQITSINDDIEVRGIVEGAVVEAGGNLTLVRGVQGMSKAVLKCNCNMVARFLESVENVSVGGNLETDTILHSKVEARGSVTAL